MTEILVKYEGNNSPRYNGKIWREKLESVVEVNQQVTQAPTDLEVKRGDRVVVYRFGKGAKRGRRWKGVVMSQSDLMEEASLLAPKASSGRKRAADKILLKASSYDDFKVNIVQGVISGNRFGNM